MPPMMIETLKSDNHGGCRQYGDRVDDAGKDEGDRMMNLMEQKTM